MRNSQTPLLTLLICTLLLSGCGQTGPLYLPEPEPEPEHPQQPHTATDSQTPDS